jgi:hypothetical protein
VGTPEHVSLRKWLEKALTTKDQPTFFQEWVATKGWKTVEQPREESGAEKQKE